MKRMKKPVGYKRNSKKKMKRNYKCKRCMKSYATEWAKNNHQKLCIERGKSIEARFRNR